MSLENKKIIGILGCGWLGLPLAKQLVEEGYIVRGSTTQASKLDKIKQTGASAFIVLCEEDKCTGLATFLTQIYCLIIALPPGLRANPERRFDLVIQNIHKEIIDQGVQKVLFISSTSVYGETEGTIVESTPTAPVSSSGKQLVQCEQILQISTVYDTSIIRFGGLIGPNRHPVYNLAKRAQINNPVGRINFIHLDDCIELIKRCIQYFKQGSIYNGVSPYHPSRLNYYSEMGKKAAIQLPPFKKQQGIIQTISSQKAEKNLGMRFTVENLLTLN
jgi:nucleoside-diphosphate-sugar epimerase